ncbi:TIGR00341 family protein [bacterium]|nr:TIGR00341 family protein [candidate division CSSED10-310 bacterium]
MALRLIKIVLPVINASNAREYLNEQSGIILINEQKSDKQSILECLVSAEGSEATLDYLEKRFGHVEGFRIVLFPIEATIPRIDDSETDKNTPVEETSADIKKKPADRRISRVELYDDIQDMTQLTSYYISMVFLAAIVAGLGILRSNPAVIIGAMIIAPLLGPSVALSFGSALGDFKLIRQAAASNLVGIFLVILVSIGWGLIANVDPELPELINRTRVTYGDIVLASVSGTAGVLSLTMGTLSVLVGVMIAVALLPPLVTGGLLLGSGHYSLANGAFMVFLANFICVNLSGIVVFLIKGIHPLTWWETKRARRAARAALALWLLILAVLIAVISLNY